MIAAALVMLLIPNGQSRFARATETGRFEVFTHESDEGLLLTVHADNAPIDRLVRGIGRKIDRQVVGLEDVGSNESVAVYFDRRPLNEAVHWILGSAGLRGVLSADTIRVYDDTPPFPESAELLNLAEVAWIRALRNHPNHPSGAAAEMALAQVQEERGALAAAINHYEYLIERYPDSEFAPEAMLVAGIHFGELGEWDAAARRFQGLTQLDRPHAYSTLARIELARALCYSNQPTSALYTLDALDLHYPPTSDQDKRSRLILRGRALALLGNAVDALRAVDLARAYGVSSEPGLDVLEVRAMALERSERFGEASVAWLRLANETAGELHKRSVESAARNALAAGDELGVLFIEAWADDRGSVGVIQSHVTEARVRIGLETESVINLNAPQQLAHGKSLFEAGMSDEAVRTLQPLHRQRAELSEELQLDLGLSFAKALEAETLTDLAVEVLRETAEGLSEPDARRRIYVLASTILEENGRLQDALDALEGRL